MYSEWTSLVDEIKGESSVTNVLSAYPPHSSKDVVNIILKSLTEAPRAKDLPVTLNTHEQVKWTMEVIGHGLALPLSEYNLMHLCIDVYDSWLTAIHTPKKSVPKPVKDKPDRYIRTIIQHLCQVFSPSDEAQLGNSNLNSSTVQVNLENQALLCKRVLRIFHHAVSKPSTKITREIWDSFLCCLLRITDIVLAPPSKPNSIANNLREFPVHVLFEAWLRASIDFFPRPQLWKSLHEFCCQWRHHGVLANEWTHLVYTLTYYVIENLYTVKFLSDVELSKSRMDPDFSEYIKEMSHDVLVQCWFRMLHTLGNPVELSYPNIIANSPAFKKHASEHLEGETSGGLRSKTTQIPSPTQANLLALPRIYHEVMRGVATLVYLFMQQSTHTNWAEWEETDGTSIGGEDRRKRHDSGSKGQSSAQGTSRSKVIKSQWYVSSPGLPKTPPPPFSHSRNMSHTNTDTLAILADVSKPKGNTLLRLFGSWLFQAAIWPLEEETGSRKRKSRSAVISSLSDLTHPQKSSPQVSRDPEFLLHYERGRAEAFGALCSIFTSQPCGELFQPIYLARFYHALILGLSYTSPETSHGHILTEIILHSTGLLRKDLMGVNLVVPYILEALKLILPCSFPPFKWVVSLPELRFASIDLLLSMICLPLHFLYQPLPNVFAAIPELQTSLPTPNLTDQDKELQEMKTPLTFQSLKDHLVQLILSGIIHEKGHTNKQLLLHALNVIILDIVTYENALGKMTSEESSEDEEVLSIKNRRLGPKQSDASVHSYFSNQPSGSSPSVLVNKALYICKTCLFPPEGEAVDSPVQVSLAALELLSSLAQLQFDNFNHSDSREAVNLVSEYIASQAMKDLPRHNRDLHTSIVAAFSTLLVWIHLHPYLLGTKHSLSSVMKVIELGISGRFSSETDGTITYKGHKKERPISGRVKEIAEFMLYSVMESVSSFPSPCGAESCSSLLSEEDILRRLPPGKEEDAKFQYFLMDNSLLLGLLEEPFASKTDEYTPPPTLTAVIRSPSGRHVWSMQLHHHPRSEQPSTLHLQSSHRPTPNPLSVPSSSVERRPWPDAVDREPPVKVDSSIPSLDDVLDDTSHSLYKRIFQLTSQQVETENKLYKEFRDRLATRPFPDPSTAAQPPRIQETFQTARLFLNHLGLLGIEGIKESPNCHWQPLAVLNSSHPNFSNSLSALDNLPSRFCNTVFVLHCKEGLSKPEDILASQSSLSAKPPEFIEFLHGLGWIVDPANHPGFAGKLRPSRTEDSARPVGLSAQIPSRPFPYYTDAMTELAFVMPTLRPSSGDSSASLRSVESSDSNQDVTLSSQTTAQPQNLSTQTSQLHPPPPTLQPQGPGSGQDSPSTKAMYINIEAFSSKDHAGSGVSESTVTAEGYSTYPRSSLGKKSSKLEHGGIDSPRKRWTVPQDCAAIVVWLERFEDHLVFPLEVMSGLLHGISLPGFGSHKISQSMRKSLPIIYIHKMSSGLYQIITKNSGGRPDAMAGPLLDGMVVSRRTLSVLVRQTVINMCSRHRMENEGFSPPHIKRRRKLEEMANTYKVPLTVAEFYTKLFTGQNRR